MTAHLYSVLCVSIASNVLAHMIHKPWHLSCVHDPMTYIEARTMYLTAHASCLQHLHAWTQLDCLAVRSTRAAH